MSSSPQPAAASGSGGAGGSDGGVVAVVGRRRPRNRWLAAAAAAAVLVAGGVVAAVVAGDDEPEPLATVTPTETAGADPGSTPGDAEQVVLAAPPASSARCMVPTAEAVARMEVALDGTVREVAGDQVRLEVAEWYAGDPVEGDADATVAVLTNPVDLRAAIGGVPDFEVGQRWLVAGSRGTVAVCGFTAPWTPARARVFEQAFPS